MVCALLAPVLATHPEDIFELHPAKRLRPPGADHWLGTDRMGSDIYSRLLFGARITLLIGVIAVGASLVIGVPVGLIAGYYHGWASDLLMRVSDIFLAVPQVVLAIAIAQTLGPSLPNVILALSVTYWPWFARLVYAETRSLQNEVFIESTSALGASPLRLIVLHVLPNVASPIIVRASIGMGFTILTAAALGFLGLGAPPPTPEWGRTIAESREFLPDAWWYAAAPGVAIFLTVMGFNLLGDGLRDVLDPAHPPRARAAVGETPMDELLSVRGLEVEFATDQGIAHVLDRINLDIGHGRGGGAGGRERVREDDAGADDPRHPAPGRRGDPRGRDPLQGPGPPPGGPPRRERRGARPRHHLHPAGSVELDEPALHRRGADHGPDEVEIAAPMGGQGADIASADRRCCAATREQDGAPTVRR